MQHSASEPTTQQINDIFDSAELASAVDFDEFKKFLDHAPIAIIVSKLLQCEQRIVYANKAFEILTGRVFAEIRGRQVPGRGRHSSHAWPRASYG